MKGVILAGGQNLRLLPLTRGVPKCLLPIYDKPMIDCAIEALRLAGIYEILIVTDKAFVGNFASHLGISNNNGLKRLEFITTPAYWETPRAMCEAETFVGDDSFCLLFGDNIFTDSIKDQVDSFRQQKAGARVSLAHVDHPEHYGVARTVGTQIAQIVEKPGNWDRTYDKDALGNLAVTGCYFYPSSVFKIVSTLKPTIRQDLTISDINNYFVSQEQLEYGIVPGEWWDAGESIEKYNQVCRIVRATGVNQDRLS